MLSPFSAWSHWLRLVLWLSLTVALVLAAVAAASAQSAPSAPGDKADEARARAAEARAQEQALGAQIAEQSVAIDAVEARATAVAAEVAALEGELARARANLARLDSELGAKTQSLRRARRQHTIAQERLADRLVAIYTSDQPELVDLLVGATSLEDAFDRVETQERILELDERTAAEIRSLRAQLARERARLRALRARKAVEAARMSRTAASRRAALETVVSQRDRLLSLRTTRRSLLASVSVDRKQWEAQAAALEAQSAAVAAAATAPPPAPPPASPDAAAPPPEGSSEAESPAPAQAPTAPPSSGFVWPVRGSIVSPYGQRWGRLHAGIDISAPAGTAIVASASGRVTYAGSMSGYGLIVVIQHANNVATAYAHNSRISVSVGQSVAQGQVIAAVGCTGSCYGDHVHFEVRVGGSPVDPMSYL